MAIENLAILQQLAVLRQQVKRPRIRDRDRAFWVVLSRFWPNWQSALVLVQTQSSVGIARDFAITGGGNPGLRVVDHRSNEKFET